ncbi:MAG: alginate lyase family protein [Roseiflexaceae bacterium]
MALLGAVLASCLPQSPPPEAVPTSVPAAQASPAPRASAPTSAPAPAGTAPIDMQMLDILSRPTLARGYLTTPNELTRIARLARLGVEPYQSAVAAELKYAAQTRDATPLLVPKEIDIRGDQVEDPPYLHNGAKYVYSWALAYNLLKESEPGLAQQYALAAYDLVMEMPRAGTQVSGYQQNTRLNIASHIQNWVYAADLLADWPAPDGTLFAQSEDAQQLKTWLGVVIIRYTYNVAHLRVNNWGAWGRLTTAVIADYVGDAAPLYVQKLVKDQRDAYQVDPSAPCDAEDVETCVVTDAGTIYADAIQLHFDEVDGRMYEFTGLSCDGNGAKSMIRPDGGLPDELRRAYDCDTTRITQPYDAAARYSQFALDSMICLAELAWRRGDPSVYTHIDAASGRGAIYRAIQFLVDNDVTFKHGSMLEIANRFYTYQAGVEQDSARRAELQKLLGNDLPGILKRQDEWPTDADWVSFGTLTHGFAADETPRPPPVVAPRPAKQV